MKLNIPQSFFSFLLFLPTINVLATPIPSSSSSSSLSSSSKSISTTTNTSYSSSLSHPSSPSQYPHHYHHHYPRSSLSRPKTAKSISDSNSNSMKKKKKSSSSLLIRAGNPFKSEQSPPTMPIAPPHIQAMITCNIIRPGHSLSTVPAVVRKLYQEIWKHGGEFEAPPGEIKRVICMKTTGIFLLNTTDDVMYISYADIGGMTRDAMEACDTHKGSTNGEMKDQDGKGYIVIVSHTDKC